MSIKMYCVAVSDEVADRIKDDEFIARFEAQADVASDDPGNQYCVYPRAGEVWASSADRAKVEPFRAWLESEFGVENVHIEEIWE